MIRDDMMACMSSKEFETWRTIYYEHDPFGEWRTDLRMGKAVAAVINAIRFLTKKAPLTDQQVSQASDWWYVPPHRATKIALDRVMASRQSPAQMKAVLMAYAQKFGKVVHKATTALKEE